VPSLGSQFLDVNAIMVEHVEQIFFQIRLPVLFLHLTDDSLRRGRTERIEFQQTIPTQFEESAHFLPCSLVFQGGQPVPVRRCPVATGNSRARSWTPRPNWRSSSLPPSRLLSKAFKPS